MTFGGYRLINANVALLIKIHSFIAANHTEMQVLNFPAYTFKTRVITGQVQIFDTVRRKYVALTPEEWVRQHLICYLSEEKGVPLHMMAVERGLKLNGLNQRFDLVIFGPSGKPLLIAECKAASVILTQDVFYQIARYNMALKVRYFLISNGITHHLGLVNYDSGTIELLEDIPDYQQMSP